MKEKVTLVFVLLLVKSRMIRILYENQGLLEVIIVSFDL